jgi:hypothetical protein
MKKLETPLSYSLGKHSEYGGSVFLPNGGTHLPDAWCHKIKNHNISPLEPELSAQCTLQKLQDLNGYPLLCMFLGNGFIGHLVFSASHCMSNTGDSWHQKVSLNDCKITLLMLELKDSKTVKVLC